MGASDFQKCSIECSCSKRVGFAYLGKNGHLEVEGRGRYKDTNRNAALVPSLPNPYWAWEGESKAQFIPRYEFWCQRCDSKKLGPVGRDQLRAAVVQAVAAKRSVRFGWDIC